MSTENQLSAVFRWVSQGFQLEERAGKRYLRTPFLDLDGESIEVGITPSEEGSVDDGGKIAAILFEFDQDAESSSGFRLVKQLLDAQDLSINFDEGLVQCDLAGRDTGRAIWLMGQTIAALATTIPFLPTPQRQRPSLGPRLRRKIRKEMVDLQVLDFVEQRHEVPGQRIESWTVDFYYRPVDDHRPGQRVVIVNTVDLDVADPVPKAEHVLALAMDVRQRLPDSSIRILFDTHGRNSESEQASNLIAGYQSDLKYEAFDYRREEEAIRFRTILEQELLEPHALWRELRR